MCYIVWWLAVVIVMLKDVSSSPGKFSCFSLPWNNSGKLYGIKSPEYFSLCNFIPSTLRSIIRNSVLNLGQCTFILWVLPVFLDAPMAYKAKSAFLSVNASLHWLNNVSGVYLKVLSSHLN
jgi:hypothetical protein